MIDEGQEGTFEKLGDEAAMMRSLPVSCEITCFAYNPNGTNGNLHAKLLQHQHGFAP